ncbi:MAG TPA: acyl-CoA thioesterase [Treponemataceae bacterium]|jgi:acyl-CoA hydrolase|nr:acyl-CoA thioesterase [Treponema sp.]OQB04462.1 MAG: Thioesterase superfamily protein [Spirochaetes bacterium ADurb.Bin215]HOU37337.1 acyl-CoA thioesterase [Treponemataceae bacterium]HPA10832.1 acyl-CoA thioesterase [Treponemataceae bacterium]HPX13232.1 acyl-CoA thioesterase [Treponemataceae bacterium]
MDTFTLVRTGHLNHQGNLFGGQLLKWVDEYAWLAATRDYCASVLVTRAMNNSEFSHAVPNGSILRFHMERVHEGRTSVRYSVDVYAERPGHFDEILIFSNTVTFVSVNAEGEKTPLIKSDRCRSTPAS